MSRSWEQESYYKNQYFKQIYQRFPNKIGIFETFYFETNKFTIDYSNTAAKIRKQQSTNLEQVLKNCENNLISNKNRKLYSNYKNELETVYDHIADAIRIAIKFIRYKYGENATKLSLNLEKKQGVQKKQIRRLIVEEN